MGKKPKMAKNPHPVPSGGCELAEIKKEADNDERRKKNDSI